jgi:polyisoprenyl-phosphate glycosyltransferase
MTVEEGTASRPTLSIVVPVFDEAGCLDELHRRVTEVCSALVDSWELVLVDDGSRDGSAEVIDRLAAVDECVHALHFTRNFGHQTAVTAGLDHARGDAVIIMDADLQDPPEVIPELVSAWRGGARIVSAVRTSREGETRFKRATASLFYRVLRRVTDVEISLDAGDFRLLDRQVLAVMGSMRERHRFLRAMAGWTGFSTAEVGYHRPARFAGETKYPLRKMLRLALTAVTGYSHVPLQLATAIGFVCAAAGAVLIPTVVGLRIAGVAGLGGQTTVLIAVLFFGGVQLLSLGILGEYVGRIYDEVKQRPLYVLRPEDDSDGFSS